MLTLAIFIFNLLVIAFVCSFAVGYNHFFSNIREPLSKLLSKALTNGKMSNIFKLEFLENKPFSCPLCLTFWTSILYTLILIISGSIVFNFVTILIICLVSLSTTLFTEVIKLTMNIIETLFNLLNLPLHKINMKYHE